MQAQVREQGDEIGDKQTDKGGRQEGGMVMMAQVHGEADKAGRQAGG